MGHEELQKSVSWVGSKLAIKLNQSVAAVLHNDYVLIIYRAFNRLTTGKQAWNFYFSADMVNKQLVIVVLT